MPLYTNLGTKERTNSVNPDDAQAWLDANPQNKAENLTGKMHHTTIALNAGYEGAVLDRAAKKEREKEARKAQKEAKAKHVFIMRDKKISPPVARFQKAVKLLKDKLKAGQLVTLDDMGTTHSRDSKMKMISKLRDSNVDVVTIRRGNVLVGWMLYSTVLDKGESA